MRKPILLVALISTLALSTSFAGAGAGTGSATRTVASTGTLTERQQVDQEIAAFDQGIAAAPLEERFKILAKGEAVIHAIRDHSDRQSEDDEIYFDTYLDLLREIPRDKHFKKSSCGDYANRVKIDFQPNADNEPLNPAVEAGLKTLAALCS